MKRARPKQHYRMIKTKKGRKKILVNKGIKTKHKRGLLSKYLVYDRVNPRTGTGIEYAVLEHDQDLFNTRRNERGRYSFEDMVLRRQLAKSYARGGHPNAKGKREFGQVLNFDSIFAKAGSEKKYAMKRKRAKLENLSSKKLMKIKKTTEENLDNYLQDYMKGHKVIEKFKPSDQIILSKGKYVNVEVLDPATGNMVKKKEWRISPLKNGE